MPLAFSIIDQGIHASIIAGGVGLIFAIILIRKILAASPGTEKMQQIGNAVQEGAKAYLNRQIVAVSLIAIVIFILLWIFRDRATAIGFVLGAVCSLAAGYIGMRIAVLANTRTAQAASQSRAAGMHMAFSGGAVTGMLVVGLALVAVGVYFLAARHYLNEQQAVMSLVGVALGASLISVFARLGGGIYTKAADVGADLVGKIESKLDEDDPRNPATIADNVGDNVGDCAGMAADVFETYAVSLIGAVLLGFLLFQNVSAAIIYPFVLGGISVIGAILSIIYVNISKSSPTTALIGSVIISGIFSAILYYPATNMLFPEALHLGDKIIPAINLYYSALVGLVLTGLVVFITNYYTSTAHAPVRKIAKASETGHATNIIAGLAVGNQATALPVICIALAILTSYHFAGLYGIAVAVMSMLSLSGIIISLDAFGPITDNAGGIAVMGEMPKEVRTVTDELDAVGNTMKAVTKGYAIASAGLAALVLFGSYKYELEAHLHLTDIQFSLNNPAVVVGLLIGGLLPFLFTAFSMNAVGKAAGAVVLEERRQLQAKPGILQGTDIPDYGTCVDIVTRAALREMIIPALLPLLGVLIVASAALFGYLTDSYMALGGVLMGTIVTGLFQAIAMTSSGGAWDNAKKYIEEGNLGGKGSDAHAAAVTGDTVGDPYKDTSGPAINPMIKVVNILAILIIPIFFKYIGH